MNCLSTKLLVITILAFTSGNCPTATDSGAMPNSSDNFVDMNIASKAIGYFYSSEDKDGLFRHISRVVEDTFITDYSTPFFHNKIVNKKATVIFIDSIIFPLKKWDRKMVMGHKWNCMICYDSEKDILLKIQCTSTDRKIDSTIMPPMSWSERERDSSLFMGLPEKPPKLSFIDVLDEVAGGNPLLASEITASIPYIRTNTSILFWVKPVLIQLCLCGILP